MRAIRLILLIFALFCISLLCIVKMQSTQFNAVREILALGTENCTQPCWNDITLGRTTPDQATQIMLQDFEIKAKGIGWFDISYANTPFTIVFLDDTVHVPNSESANVSTIEFQVDVALGDIMFKDPPAYIGYIVIRSGTFPVLINAEQNMMLITKHQLNGLSECMSVSPLDRIQYIALTSQLPSVARNVYGQRWNGFKTCY